MFCRHCGKENINESNIENHYEEDIRNRKEDKKKKHSDKKDLT